MVDVVPMRHLVADVSDDGWLVFLLVFNGLTKNIDEDDTFGIPSLSNLQEQFVENGVFQRMIELAAVGIRFHPQRQRRNPFPVEDMTQEEGARLTVLDTFVEGFHAFEHHVATHLPLAHRHHFHRFDKIVAEASVEFPFDAAQFLLRFLWKRCFEVVSHDFNPIAQYPINNQEEEVAQEIENAKWQKRQQIPEAAQQVIEDGHRFVGFGNKNVRRSDGRRSRPWPDGPFEGAAGCRR